MVLFCCRKGFILNCYLKKMEEEEEFKCMPDLDQYFPITHRKGRMSFLLFVK